MAISDAIKRLISAFDPFKDPKAVPGESIEATIDQLAETVKDLPEPSGGGEHFEIVCTPTAQDFSGTMDKTMAEILEAYNAGCDIWFALVTSEGTQKVRLSDAGFANNVAYPSFNTAFLYVDQDMLMKFHTGTTDQADRNTYTTTIYPLTPYDPNNSNM